jgi:hypothetical protein
MDGMERLRTRRAEEEEASEERGPATVPAGPAARILEMQRGWGNAAVSRAVSGGVLARRTKPDARSSVGAATNQATFLPGAAGEENDTLAIGQQGFTIQMLKEVPKAAGKQFANYTGAHLEPVQLSTRFLDEDTLPRISKEWREADDAKDSMFNTPSTTDTYTKRAAKYEQQLKQLTQDKGAEQRMVQEFNAGVPRANQMFVSLARLEGMQQILGVKDPEAMKDALVKSLGEAQQIGERAQVKRGTTSVSPPKAAEQVTVAAKELTESQKKMATAWMGVQQNLMMDHAAELKKKGEDDEKRLKEIQEVITAAKNVGAVIDTSMAVMSGGKAMVEGAGGGELKPSELMDLEASEKPDLKDKSGLEGAKKAGEAVSKAMGIEIPTSASGLLETAAKIYYSFELEEIRIRLKELNAQVDAHKEAAEQIGLAKRVRDFEDAVSDFKLKAENLQKAQLDRQMAYLQLGEQLDAASRKDPKAAADAPDAKHERFATVMTVTSAVREVLAMAEGAKAGFGADAATRKLEIWQIIQNRSPWKWPDDEDKSLGKMVGQQSTFEANVDELKKMLGPIDEAAGKMMTALSAGDKAAAEY